MKIRAWPFRRVVQVSVLMALFALPLVSRYSHYLYARQLDKLNEQWAGTTQGVLLEATDATMRIGIPDGEGGVATRRPRKAILERAKDFYGSAWSARIFGVSMTDLLAAAESTFASKGITWVLFIGILIPLIATFLLGRVYCGWVCPMGFLFDMGYKLRGLIRFLEIRPLNVRFWTGNKYILLGIGLLFSLVTALPLLHYVYPPALLGREAHSFVMALFDRAEAGRMGLVLTGLTGASLFLLGLMAFEIAVAPGFWCKSLCPGGAIYSLLGRYRMLRAKRIESTCTACGDCNRICPRGLQPMVDKVGMECDNCGLCVDVCEPRSMVFRISLKDGMVDVRETSRPKRPTGRIAAMVCLMSLAAVTAHGHHIMGIPHYSYDESYPQAPVLKLVEQVGNYEIQLTSYPGNPEPGVRTQLNIYVLEAKNKLPLDKPVKLSVFQQPAMGPKKIIYGPEETSLNENVFKFYPTYSEEGNYEVLIEFDDGGRASSLRSPMVVGEPGSPWRAVLWFGGGLGLFVVVVRAVKIKRARRMKDA